MFQDALTGKRATRQSAALERKSSFLSDATFESISESETSTAPSSLQTIVRGPAALGQYAGMISEYEEEETASESPSPPSNHQGPLPPPLRRLGPPLINTLVLQEAGPDSENFANNLRKVSEQLLANNGRTRTSVSGPAGGSSRPGSVALLSPREQQQQRELAGSLLRITSGGPASIGPAASRAWSIRQLSSRRHDQVAKLAANILPIVQQQRQGTPVLRPSYPVQLAQGGLAPLLGRLILSACRLPLIHPPRMAVA